VIWHNCLSIVRRREMAGRMEGRMAMGGISYRTGNKAGIIFEPGDSPIALSKAVKGAYKSTYALVNR
jgi:hypothetical protein